MSFIIAIVATSYQRIFGGRWSASSTTVEGIHSSPHAHIMAGRPRKAPAGAPYRPREEGASPETAEAPVSLEARGFRASTSKKDQNEGGLGDSAEAPRRSAIRVPRPKASAGAAASGDGATGHPEVPTTRKRNVAAKSEAPLAPAGKRKRRRRGKPTTDTDGPGVAAVGMLPPPETGKAAVECGRCLKTPQEVPFPQLPNADGELENAGSACLKCWKVYSRAIAPLGKSWAQLCGECAEEHGRFT